ncbi:MAG TPA: GNAT family N-acetyltransferase [Thermoleophilia bacterium]|nr:GNAT family N-acetyltransferase [Thermoleophilia bacterium]
MTSIPPPFVQLGLTPDERAQIEGQLAACFDLAPEAARTWVETTARRGACFARVANGGVIAASYAAETLPLVHGEHCRTAVMLQSYYVHPAYRGRGYGLARTDVEELCRRFAADAVVLTLFDDGLMRYWRRRGFEVVQRAEVVDLSSCLSRAETAFSPALGDKAIAAKLAETTADGATVTELSPGDGALLLVRYPGDDVVEELIVRDPHVPARCRAAPAVAVRLKTVMASPGDLDLICAIDL